MFKKFFSKVKSKGKLYLGVLGASVAAAVMSVGAFAEGETSVPTMSGVISDAGVSFQSAIGELVTAVVPVVIGTFGVALIIFGIMWLIKTIKKVFTKTSN